MVSYRRKVVISFALGSIIAALSVVASFSPGSKTAYIARITNAVAAYYPTLHVVNISGRGVGAGFFLKQLPKIDEAKPQIVTILPIWDYFQMPPQVFTTRYHELLDNLARFKPTVFFGDLHIDASQVWRPNSTSSTCFSNTEYQALQTKNEILASLAREYPFIVIVPLYEPLGDGRYNDDGTGHLNDIGHLYLAEQFWQAISTWLTCKDQPAKQPLTTPILIGEKSQIGCLKYRLVTAFCNSRRVRKRNGSSCAVSRGLP